MKRIISLIAVFVLCLSVVAGCGNTAVEESAVDIKAETEAYKVSYTLTEEEELTEFFMDREYAVDAESAKVTQAELDKAGKFLTDYILEAASNGTSAFDVMIGDVSFAEDIKNWTLSTETTSDDETATQYTLTYKKNGEVLTVTVYATLYKEYPIIEWTVWLSNEGSAKSAQITELNALDYTFGADNAASEFKLTTFEGSHEANTSFCAETKVLEVEKSKTVNGTGGKSSVTWSPYVNLQWTNENASWGKEGVFLSNGWSGQWVTKLTNTGSGVDVIEKQESLDTYLNPGESLRSPLVTILFWEKDLMRSQNIWRDWVYNVAMPQPNGEPIQTMVHGNTAQDTDLTLTATTENQVEAINKWVEWGLDIDAWQMDAGWYDPANNSTSWVDTGSWTPSLSRFNGSLSTVSDTLHDNDIDFILWYEPERMVTNSEWQTQFKGTDYIINEPGWQLYNLSSDEATDWLIDYMINSIEENGVDIYRQDCNINQPSLKMYWEELEEEGRKGYVENKYVRNYLRFFDAIVEATGTFIDCCASGGKRLDLETTKRAVALWRDDSCYTATLTQCQSWGINFFMPYSGQGSLDQSSGTMLYTFRSNMMTYTGLPWKLSLINESNIDLHKQVIQEHKDYAHYLTQEYYPLTAFSESEDAWMAMQYNDASDSTGIVEVFKRTESKQTEATFYLNGLQADTTYKVTDIDTGDSVEMTGKDLMCNGVIVCLQEDFAAEIFYYEPVA